MMDFYSYLESNNLGTSFQADKTVFFPRRESRAFSGFARGFWPGKSGDSLITALDVAWMEDACRTQLPVNELLF